MNVSTIRPGLLVALSSKVTGNVSFNRKELEAPHIESDGALVSLTEVERSVRNPREYEDAIKTRSKCRSLIVSICSTSSFGLLCPEDRSDELRRAIEEAQQLADGFNQTAEVTQVSIFVIIGHVAQDDVQAVRAINSEVRDLMEAMETGLKKLDVKAVRDAARKAKELGAMLSPDAESRVADAIKVARGAARKIVLAAETGAGEIDQATLTFLRQSRTAFLDYSADEDAEIATPDHTGRAIDLEMEAIEELPPVPVRQPAAIELE